jgi:hypothetical protein
VDVDMAKAGTLGFWEVPALPCCDYSVSGCCYFFSQPRVVQSGTWDRLRNRDGP